MPGSKLICLGLLFRHINDLQNTLKLLLFCSSVFIWPLTFQYLCFEKYTLEIIPAYYYGQNYNSYYQHINTCSKQLHSLAKQHHVKIENQNSLKHYKFCKCPFKKWDPYWSTKRTVIIFIKKIPPVGVFCGANNC